MQMNQPAADRSTRASYEEELHPATAIPRETCAATICRRAQPALTFGCCRNCCYFPFASRDDDDLRPEATVRET